MIILADPMTVTAKRLSFLFHIFSTIPPFLSPDKPSKIVKSWNLFWLRIVSPNTLYGKIICQRGNCHRICNRAEKKLWAREFALHVNLQWNAVVHRTQLFHLFAVWRRKTFKRIITFVANSDSLCGTFAHFKHSISSHFEIKALLVPCGMQMNKIRLTSLPLSSIEAKHEFLNDHINEVSQQ